MNTPFVSVDYFGFQMVKLVSQLCNYKKAICYRDGCGMKPVVAMDGNMSNSLMYLGRHNLEQYAELIEAQEKCQLNTAIVIYTVILYT